MYFNWKAEDNGVPLYQQLYEYIKELIHKGYFDVGQPLPSVRETSRMTGLGKNTILSSFELLSSDGYIDSKPRRRASVIWRKGMPTSPDWFQYLSKSKYVQTDDIYRSANIMRSKAQMINLFDTRLGQDFFPDEPIKKAVSATIRRLGDIHHQSYYDIKGIPWVREAICAYLHKYNIYADSSQVLLAQGPINSITTITHSLLAPGMNVYVPSPNTISPARPFFTAGLNTVEILQDEQGIIPHILDGKTRNRKGLLYLHSFSSWPSTITMSENRIKDVLKVCVKNKLPLVECDMMRECWAEKPSVTPVKSYDSSENVIYIFAVTRPLMPGLRTSAIVGPEVVINRLADVRQQMDLMQDNMSQLVLGELLAGGIFDEYSNKIRPLLKERLNEADALMHRYLDGLAVWRKSPYGLHFWVEFDKRLDTAEFHTEEHGVLIYPGRVCGDEFKHCMWICYAGITLPELEHSLSVVSNAAYRSLKK